MAFGNEIKDFINAFDKGYEMFKSPQERRDAEEDKNYVRQKRLWEAQDRLTQADDRARKLAWDTEDRANAADDRAYETSLRPLKERAAIVGVANSEANLDQQNIENEIKRRTALPDTGADANKILDAGGYNPDAPTRAPVTPQSNLDSLIEKYSVTHGVPVPLTKAVIHQESHGDPMAISPVTANGGYVGLMQLGTAAAKDVGVTDRLDPEQNIYGGTKYLGSLIKKYGDTPTALAAYNWGQGHMDDYLKTHEKGDLSGVPAETKDYVTKITKNIGPDLPNGIGNPGADVSGLPQTLVQQGHEVVRDTLNTMAEESGAGSAVPTPESQKASVSMLTGEGGAPPTTVQVLFDRIRKQLPKDTTDEEVGMRAFGAMRDYYMKIGEPEKAQGAAKELMQYYQGAFNKYAAIAKAAAAKGNTDDAVKAAVKAYANIPDGRITKATKNKDGSYTVELTDIETGKPVMKQVLSPDQIGEMALHLSPGTFASTIIDAAGLRQQSKNSPEFQSAMSALDGVQQPDTTAPNARLGSNVVKGGRAIPDTLDYDAMSRMSTDEVKAYKEAFEKAQNKPRERRPEDMATIGTAADTAFGEFITNPGLDIPQEVRDFYGKHKTDIVNASTKLMADSRNHNLSPKDANDTITDMISVDPASPGLPRFRPIKTNQDGSVDIKVPGHATVTMDREGFDRLAAIWGAAADSKMKEIQEAGAAAKRSAARAEAVVDAAKPIGDVLQGRSKMSWPPKLGGQPPSSSVITPHGVFTTTGRGIPM